MAFKLALILFTSAADAQSVVVQPYLQEVTPDSAWILWETTSGDQSQVDWGETSSLGNSDTGVSLSGRAGSRMHQVQLTGLSPGTAYQYQVTTGSAVSAIYRLVTPQEPEAEASFRLVAMSDMQQDSTNPDKFREVVEDGILAFSEAEFGPAVEEEIEMVLVAGDLVDYGWDYDSWAETFFEPARDLLSYVPVYPVLGNHESDADYYFQYFHLPENGSPGLEEHWWWIDHGNLRVIGLDSNSAYTDIQQLTWLDGVLAEACVEPNLDFVFAQLHHPYLSELWLDGETDWTGQVIERLETFTEDCGKPSIHFFGHTHGYSRGQSQDHRHLWVNAATAGGNVDYWGEYAQADYDEFTVSHDAYGFVVVEVQAGDDPTFRLRRVSRGNELDPLDNVVRDDLTVFRVGSDPETPAGLWPQGEDVSPDCVVLRGPAFSDSDDDLHGASQWQMAPSCEGFETPLLDRWRQHENWYEGVDLQAGDDLTDEEVTGLEADTDYCWRVRYRDRGLSWSEWSEPLSFRTGQSVGGDELLLNPGAESGVEHWTATQGYLESLTDGECGGVDPHGGSRYFAVGGLCDEASAAEAFQSLDLASHAEDIDGGQAAAVFGGWFRDWAGDDQPQMRLVFRDGDGNALSESQTLSARSATWTELTDIAAIPVGSRSVDVVLQGIRNAGVDNDSYLDDLTLRLALSGASDCDDGSDEDTGLPNCETSDTADTGGPVDSGATEPGDSATDTVPTDDPGPRDDDTGEGSSEGCGCSQGPSMGPGWCFLIGVGWRRRRSPRKGRAGQNDSAR
jgi:hypothetical protein